MTIQQQCAERTLSEIVRKNVEKDLEAVSIEICGGSSKLSRSEYNELYTEFQASQIALIEGMIEILAGAYKIVPIPATDRETLILGSYNTALSEVHDLLQEQLAIIKEIK